MRFIDRAAAEAAIDVGALIDFMEACHREPPAVSGDVLLADSDRSTDAFFLGRAAWRSGRSLGIKFGPILPANAARGLPTVVTLVALFEGETGQPLCLIDGHPVTNWKTAADSALAARRLARADAEQLLLVGAGTLAPYLVKAHLAVRPSLRVAVWNRSRERAAALVEALAQTGVEATAAADLEAAVRAADVISTATMAKQPLVRGAWLKPGCHLDLVGSYLPEMQEADLEALTRGRVVVDTREGTVGRCGELIEAVAAGVLDETRLPDLYDLAAGGHDRRDAREITVFKNAGGGHLDLITAEFVARRCGLMR